MLQEMVDCLILQLLLVGHIFNLVHYLCVIERKILTKFDIALQLAVNPYSLEMRLNVFDCNMSSLSASYPTTSLPTNIHIFLGKVAILPKKISD